MLNFAIKNLKWLVCAALVFTMTMPATAANLEIGGYVAQAESRFQRNVWNFIKEFKNFYGVTPGTVYRRK